MKTRKLDLSQIKVVSFTMETTKNSRGTVNAFSADTDIGCGGTGGNTDNGWSCRICLPMPDTYTCDICH